MSVLLVDRSAPRIERRRLGRTRSRLRGGAFPLDAITLVLHGHLTVRERNRRPVRVRAGEFVQLVDVRSAPATFIPSADCVECSVAIDTELASRLAELDLWTRRRRHAKAPPGFADHFAALQDQLADLATPEGRILRTLAALCDALAPPRSATATDAPAPWRAKACDLLASSGPGETSLPQVAARVGMSFSTFRRRFHEETGLSPGQYRLRARMQRARELLQTHSVKEVAALLGYADPFVFSRCFKRTWGCPPSACRA